MTHGVGFAPWSQRAYGLKIDDPGLDLFLLDGVGDAAQLAQYTALTGRAPLPPLWSLGVILSKAYYRDSAEILAAATEVRRRRMPCDVITFDVRAWQDTDTRFAFEWCPKRYPDSRPTVAALKALAVRICVWEYPLVSVRNPLFREMASRGWPLKDARTGEAYRYSFDPEPFGAVLTQLPESGLGHEQLQHLRAWQGVVQTQRRRQLAQHVVVLRGRGRSRRARRGSAAGSRRNGWRTTTARTHLLLDRDLVAAGVDEQGPQDGHQHDGAADQELDQGEPGGPFRGGGQGRSHGWPSLPGDDRRDERPRRALVDGLGAARAAEVVLANART